MSLLPEKDIIEMKCECGGELVEIEIPGTVLDPFGGSGSTGAFCRKNNRNAILFEINSDYRRQLENNTLSHTPELSKWL